MEKKIIKSWEKPSVEVFSNNIIQTGAGMLAFEGLAVPASDPNYQP